jgi:hypothetical protein
MDTSAAAALGLRRYTARARPMRTLSNGGCRSHLKGPPKRMRRYNAYNPAAANLERL